MSTGDYTTHAEAVDALADGSLSRARVDESVRRVLALKCEYKVAEHRFADPRLAERVSGNAAFQRTALKMGLAATTLVKNEGGVLPFDPDGAERTLVAGVVQTPVFAGEIAEIAHGPVESWQAATTDPTDAEIADAVRRAGSADRVVVATYSSGKPPAGQAKLVRGAAGDGQAGRGRRDRAAVRHRLVPGRVRLHRHLRDDRPDPADRPDHAQGRRAGRLRGAARRTPPGHGQGPLPVRARPPLLTAAPGAPVSPVRRTGRSR